MTDAAKAEGELVEAMASAAVAADRQKGVACWQSAPEGVRINLRRNMTAALAAIRGMGWCLVPKIEREWRPIEMDQDGVVRFRAHPLVRFLIDHGSIDLSRLAMVECSDADRALFAQWLGYSVSGWGDLSYVDGASCDHADVLASAMLSASPLPPGDGA